MARSQIHSLHRGMSLPHTIHRYVCTGWQMIQWRYSQDMAGWKRLTKRQENVAAYWHQNSSRPDARYQGRRSPLFQQVFPQNVAMGTKAPMASIQVQHSA